MASRRKRAKRNTVVTPEIEAPKTGGDGGDTSDPKDYNRWVGRMDAARERRKSWETDYKVDVLAKTYLGRKPIEDDENRVVNKFESTIQTILPGLFLRAPKFFVRPRQGSRRAPVEDRQAAIAESLLEAIGDQDQNLKKAVRLALQQMFFRMGALKVVYDPRLVPNPRAGEPIFGPEQTFDEEGGSRPQSLVDSETGEPLVEPAEVMDDEAYRYEWVDAQFLLLPDCGPDQKKWDWVAEEIEITLVKAKADPLFSHVKHKLKSNRSRDAKFINKSEIPGDMDVDTEMFYYIEIWDLEEKTRMIMAEGQDFEEFIVNDPIPEGIEDHPYAFLTPYPIIDPEPMAWPKPVTHSWLDLQEEYNIRRNQIMQGAKGSARKIYYDNQTFEDEDEAQKALASSRDLEGVKIQDTARPPIQTNDAPLNSAVLTDIGLLNADWQAQTGMIAPESSRAETAFEVGVISRQGDAKDAFLADQVNDWLGTAGKKMFQLVKKTMTLGMHVMLRDFKEQEVAALAQRLYGVEAQMLEQFPALKQELKQRFMKFKAKQVTREDLVFDADVTVVPGSSRPMNTVAEKQTIMQLTAMVGQNPAVFMIPKLVQRILRAYDMDDPVLAEELQLMAKQMVQINAKQAGREQGGAGGGQGADPNALGNGVASLLGGIQ